MSRITIKEALSMSTEKFNKMLENADRSSDKVGYWVIIILFTFMFIVSFVAGIIGSMEAYVAFPITVLCLIGIILSAVSLKKLYK